MGSSDPHRLGWYARAVRDAFVHYCGAVLVVVLLAPAAQALSCANPDNLCRGNPCTIGALDLPASCVVDFGDRVLVVRGTLKVPNGGVLSLKAGSIDVRRPIIGRRARKYADGADITLTATRDISVRWRIDASGRTKPGKIHLVAGANVHLLAPLRAAAKGLSPRAAGGSITVDAGGDLSSRRRARIRANGAATTAGGAVQLNAGRSIALESRISAFGRDGGHVSVSAGAGNISFARPVDVEGVNGDGGTILVRVPGGRITAAANFEAQGLANGGSITFIGGGSVSVAGSLRADSTVRIGDGGSVAILAGGDVTLDDVVAADGSTGGRIVVSSQDGTARLNGVAVVAGTRGAGGQAMVVGGTQAVVANAVDADGGTEGGTIDINGGAVALTSSGGLFARGRDGGTINIDAASISIALGARVLADGDLPGGLISLSASGGDLVLDGDFRARGRTGGHIEGMATGAVFAGGDFAARGSGGCISLSAGSTLDTTGGLFDTPVVDMCP